MFVLIESGISKTPTFSSYYYLATILKKTLVKNKFIAADSARPEAGRLLAPI
jgi:hypothetical protein